jgi:hypothetical protein
MKPIHRIELPSNGSGFKTEGMWLAEALGCKWSRRRGYHLSSARRVEQWQALLREGFEASRKYFHGDKRPYTFTNDALPGVSLSLSQALEIAEGMPPMSKL